MKTVLTEAEEREFTKFNAGAYDLHRVESQAKNTVPPCWLTMSDEAKVTCRKRFVEHLQKTLPSQFGGESEGFIELRINMISSLEPLVQRWRAAELRYKDYRSQGNPRAYFAD